MLTIQEVAAQEMAAAAERRLRNREKGPQRLENPETTVPDPVQQTLDALLKGTLTETQQPPPAHGRRLPTPAPAQPRKSRRL